ncbi:hypothetical protein PQX77_020308 [Marasmius sp. AFHP31]|nr:hypothetical protein PQX77_020308 [Marasmius sp. AFHP31]
MSTAQTPRSMTRRLAYVAVDANARSIVREAVKGLRGKHTTKKRVRRRKQVRIVIEVPDVDGTWKLRRVPDHLERQLLKFHVAVDYQELFMTKARKLFFEYAVKHEAIPVIWVDYLKSPPTIEVVSDAGSKARIDALEGFQIIPECQGIDDLKGVLVCAIIPWQGTEGSLLASYRDRIPGDKDVEAREEPVATSSPGQTRTQDMDHSNISGH